MKFLADINIPQSVIGHLSLGGNDVLDLKQVNLLATDIEVIRLAQEQERIILTLDKDFISLTQFPKYKVACIVIRLHNQSAGNIVRYLDQLLKNQRSGVLETSLTVVKMDIAESYANK